MYQSDSVKPWVTDPPDEPCAGMDAASVPHFTAPAELVQAAPRGTFSSEQRLIRGLREAAQTRDPMEILARAAVAFYRAAHPVRGLPRESVAVANALADLAMTGRVSYESWPSYGDAPVNEISLTSIVGTRLPADAPKVDVSAAVTAALDRAYAVAWALRGPVAQPASARAPLSWPAGREKLGWIAVSAEDDTAHRPVNLTPPPFEQFEIPVSARGVTVKTRFFIASAVEDVAPAPPAPAARALPPVPVPSVPDGHQVVLFVHGHSSSADEALAITPHIHAAGLARGIRYSVVSFDLPNNGYSESFDHSLIPGNTTFPADPGSGELIRTPVLDYLEDFVVAFVDALDAVTPVKNRFAGVFGGSLGGNLGLRLGRRNRPADGWLDAGIVSWSPACVWAPMVQDFVKSVGPGYCAGRWAAPEEDSSRAMYFYEAFDQNLPWHKQPWQWYRDTDWEPCKGFHIEGSRLARQEIYNSNFRRWHFRVAGEQLIYSHVDRVVHGDDSTPYRYEGNTVRQLLCAGDQDNDEYANIYVATQALAGWMVKTPGRSLFLENTGHSIHAERPHYFAGKIIEFLAESSPAPPEMSFLAPLLLSDPAQRDISFLTPLLLSGAG